MDYAAPEERDARMKDLVSLLLSVSKDQFDPFHIYKAVYKSAGHAIGVDILVPKTKSPSPSRPQPVIVRIHGGFLVSTRGPAFDEMKS